MKEIKDSTDRREIYYVFGLENSILSKWLYYPKQSTYSMQSLSNYQWHFSQIRKKKWRFVRKYKRSWIAKAILRKRNEPGPSAGVLGAIPGQGTRFHLPWLRGNWRPHRPQPRPSAATHTSVQWSTATNGVFKKQRNGAGESGSLTSDYTTKLY